MARYLKNIILATLLKIFYESRLGFVLFYSPSHITRDTYYTLYKVHWYVSNFWRSGRSIFPICRFLLQRYLRWRILQNDCQTSYSSDQAGFQIDILILLKSAIEWLNFKIRISEISSLQIPTDDVVWVLSDLISISGAIENLFAGQSEFNQGDNFPASQGSKDQILFKGPLD